MHTPLDDEDPVCRGCLEHPEDCTCEIDALLRRAIEEGTLRASTDDPMQCAWEAFCDEPDHALREELMQAFAYGVRLGRKAREEQ